MKKTAVILSLLLVSACVEGWMGGGGGGQQLKNSFVQAATRHRVPVQLLLAIGWLESRLTAAAATVLYDNDTSLGIETAQTAFGVTRRELARFSVEDADLNQLDAQVAAYAKLVRSHLDDNAIELDTNISDTATVLEWVQELAQLQRSGDEYRSNARTLFALEILAVLNRGFSWRDPVSGEEITLLPHQPRLERMLMPYPRQQFFNLRTTAAQLYRTHWLQPTYPQTSSSTNKPRRILIVHCPFSLSACLELQNANRAAGDAVLQAHYIIPAAPSSIDYPLQVAHHQQLVAITAADGRVETQADTIVIMLSGNSGRIVDNVRVAADPTWQDGFQLEWLGYMVKELCAAHLGLRSPKQIQNCSNPQHPDTRIEFRLHQAGDIVNHRWGEIADYDQGIYSAYLQQSRRWQTQFRWLDQRTNGKFQRGATIRLALPSDGRNWYVLERLVRCPDDGRLLYVPVSQSESNARGEQQFSVIFYDRGPNGDGRQFLRAKVFRRDKLRAWAIGSLQIDGYDQDAHSIHYESCAR